MKAARCSARSHVDAFHGHRATKSSQCRLWLPYGLAERRGEPIHPKAMPVILLTDRSGTCVCAHRNGIAMPTDRRRAEDCDAWRKTMRPHDHRKRPISEPEKEPSIRLHEITVVPRAAGVIISCAKFGSADAQARATKAPVASHQGAGAGWPVLAFYGPPRP